MDTQQNEPGGTIALTREQYRALVHMVLKSTLMQESLADQEPPLEREHMVDLSMHVLKFAGDFNSEDMVATDLESGVVYPAAELYEKVMEDIMDYDEVSFWEEIAHRMSEDEMVREFGTDVLDTISREEYFRLLGDKLAYFTQEFSENGLERVRIQDRD